MGFLAEIIQIASGMISQVVDTQVESVCKILRRQCYWYAWIRFAMVMMLLGAIFIAWGVCILLEPSTGKGLAAVIVGLIVILVGLVVLSITKSCHEK